MSAPAPLRCAVIGVGRAGEHTWAKGGGHQIGYAHARMFRENPRTRLAAAADINPDNLAAFLARFDVSPERGYTDFRVMLDRERPDVVSIGTYVGLHAEMLLACAEAGVRGVVCEKPFVHSIPALRRVEAAVARTGMKVVVAHIRRALPAFRTARDILRSGRIGKPLHVYAGIGGWDLSEWGSHWLDIFRFLNDDAAVLWVAAQGRVRALRGYGHAMEEHAVAHFQLANGCRCTLDGGVAMAPLPEDKAYNVTLSLAGTDGLIQIRAWLGQVRVLSSAGEEIIPVANEAFELCWPPLLEGLVAWMDGGAEPDAGFGRTAPSAELNLACYLSMVRGDRVDFPVVDTIDCWPLEVLASRAPRPA